MRFIYTGYERSGKPARGTIEAPDADSAQERLRGQGVFVTDITDAQEHDSPRARGAGGRSGLMVRGRHRKLASFSRQLSILVANGTPVPEALGAINRQTKDVQWAALIGEVNKQVQEGASLSEAIQSHPETFDPVFFSLIAAGESGGNLDVMLQRLAKLTRQQLHVRNSVSGAMLYPALLLMASVIVLGLLITFVLPRFAGLFETLDAPLPPTTEALMAVSNILRGYWWAIIPGVGLMGVGLGIWLTFPSGRRAAQTALLRAPKIGWITRGFAVARIARLLGLLVSSRVPLLDALDLTQASMTNHHYRDLIARAHESVTMGEPVWTAFDDTWLVSPATAEAIRNGEEAGQMGPSLVKLADFLDEDNEVIVRSLVSIIEPVILLGLGAVVALVAISMFLPLFDLTSMTGGAS